MQETKSLHYVLGAALALIAVFVVVALVMINSQASDTNTVVNIGDVDSTIVGDIVISTEAESGAGDHYNDADFGASTAIEDLVAGSTRTIYINGLVEDTNGAADITGVSSAFYEDNASGGNACASDANDCYKDDTCTTYAGPTTDQLYFTCGPFALEYFIDSTSTGGVNASGNWVAWAQVTDGDGSPDSDTETVEVETLLALDIETGINYGTLALGASTTADNDNELTIFQNGNDVADVEVSSAAAMTCTVRGTIPVANQEWALTSLAYNAEGTTNLSGTPVDTDINIGYRTGAAVSDILYWGITIPSSGVEGSCDGTTTITAIAH